MAIVRHLAGVQAQDARAAPLAVRARGSGFGASAVEAALADGALVVAWLMRGTLHLVAREDHNWLLALTAPRSRTMNARRLRQLGVDEARAERALGEIEATLPTERADLAARLGCSRRQTAHLLLRAALDGVCVLGAGRRIVAAPRDGARGGLAELGRRYLAAHAPADDRDLAAWSGLPLRDARAALAAAGPAGPPDPQPLPPRLLPMYDEYLLGWRDRSFAVPEALTREVHPGGGILRATAVTDGRITATWSRAGGVPDAYAAELADVEAFLRE